MRPYFAGKVKGIIKYDEDYINEIRMLINNDDKTELSNCLYNLLDILYNKIERLLKVSNSREMINEMEKYLIDNYQIDKKFDLYNSIQLIKGRYKI